MNVNRFGANIEWIVLEFSILQELFCAATCPPTTRSLTPVTTGHPGLSSYVNSPYVILFQLDLHFILFWFVFVLVPVPVPVPVVFGQPHVNLRAT